MSNSRSRLPTIGMGSMLALVCLAFAAVKAEWFRDRSVAGSHDARAVAEESGDDPRASQSIPVATVAGPRPPLGLPPLVWPRDNPYSPEKAELGRLLFFDKRLSSDGSVSCSTCHDPEKAFADDAEIPVGIAGRRGRRNTPTILNRAYSSLQFWDGRASSLEEQVLGPLANRQEMTIDRGVDEALRNVVARLKVVPGYVERFRGVFGNANLSIEQVARAIATFERTLLSGNSRYDRYLAGDRTALTTEQVRGSDVFVKKAACDRCHLASRFVDDLFYEHDELALAGRRIWIDRLTGREVPQIQGFNFTDGSFQNTGVGMDEPDADPGRYLVTGRAEEKGAFKIPTLRDVEHTAPYMHDGRFKTLREVVDYYNDGGIRNPRLSGRVRPLGLSTREKEELVAFLRALSGEGWRQIKPPRPEEFPR